MRGDTRSLDCSSYSEVKADTGQGGLNFALIQSQQDELPGLQPDCKSLPSLFAAALLLYLLFSEAHAEQSQQRKCSASDFHDMHQRVPALIPLLVSGPKLVLDRLSEAVSGQLDMDGFLLGIHDSGESYLIWGY